VAEPPVEAVVLIGALFGGFLVGCRGDDDFVVDQFVVGPVRRHRHFLLVGDLQRFHHAQDLVHVASQFLRVVQDGADDALGVYDEHRAYRVGALTRVHQTQHLGDFSPVVGNHRESDGFFQVFLDPLHPLDVREDLVNAQPYQFGVELLEIVPAFLEGNELRGANGCIVGGMAKQDEPFSGEIGGKMHFAVRCLYVKVGKSVPDQGHCSVFHLSFLLFFVELRKFSI